MSRTEMRLVAMCTPNTVERECVEHQDAEIFCFSDLARRCRRRRVVRLDEHELLCERVIPLAHRHRATRGRTDY